MMSRNSDYGHDRLVQQTPTVTEILNLPAEGRTTNHAEDN